MNWERVSRRFPRFRTYVIHVARDSSLPPDYVFSFGGFLAELFLLNVSESKAVGMLKRKIKESKYEKR